MQHLDTERLAALIDESPTDEELLHLAACHVCRTEREAFAALSGMAVNVGKASVGANAPRLTDWNALSVRLRAEGLIVGEPITAEHAVPTVIRSISGGLRAETESASSDEEVEVRVAPRAARGRFWSVLPAPYLQIAAALTLVIGGLALGRISAGVPVLPTSGGPQVSQSGIGMIGLGNDGFTSIGEATQTLSRAQGEYERAALWLANHDTTITPAMYRKRLAALDLMMTATREALHQAPADPVLNNYYDSAVKAREATLQQLSGVLPVNKIIERF